MADIWTACLITLLVFGAALLGLRMRRSLPGPHLASEARDGVVRGTSTISLLASLVLGLLLSTSKATLDNTDRQIQLHAADLVALDQALQDYGPEAAALRGTVREVARRTLRDIWPPAGAPFLGLSDEAVAAALDSLARAALDLPAAGPAQQWARGQMLELTAALRRQRILLGEQAGPTVRPIFLVVLVAWISALFFFYGLHTPANGSTLAAFLVFAVVTGSAFFLILEMDSPLEGILRISSTPLERALRTMQ
ncbi:bestrophin-like domain [Roseomonas sp. USHLN139]|uniref:bestrophin-like domain n=1 Tax=Roseomonas sp. USHLN139 TaxID=3081298 RepID=UPI003B021E7F